MRRMKIFTLAASMILLAASLSAGAITTGGQVDGTQLDIIGVTGFTTTGNQMAGITVTAFYSTGGSNSCTWLDLGGTAGGCAVDGEFIIVQDGNTFSEPWTLANTSTFQSINALVITGNGLIVFDRTFDGADGTLGSEAGKDADGSTTDDSVGTATYFNLAAISPAAAVGDIFSDLGIFFEPGLGPGATATFVADTDTVGVFGGEIPEPSTMILLGAGLAAIAAVRRRSA